MLEPAAREDRGQVGGHVRVRVPEVGAVEDHRAVQQRRAAFAHALQAGEQVGEQLHVPFVDGAELRQLRVGTAVVGEVVVAVGDLRAIDLDGGRVDAVEQQRDGPGGIGLEGEPRQVVHEPDLLHVLTRARRIERHACGDSRLGPVLPFARHLHPLLQFAHAREILVEPVAVVRTDAALQGLRLVGHGIEDATAELQLAHLVRLLRLGPLDEEMAEDFRSLLIARDEHAGAGPRKTAHALLDVDAEVQGREPRQMPDALGDVLVERDGVAEAAAARMRRGGEEAVVRRMPAVHVRMRHAAEDGQVVAVRLQVLQIRRQRVAAAGLLGEEPVGQQA